MMPPALAGLVAAVRREGDGWGGAAWRVGRKGALRRAWCGAGASG